MPNTHIEHPEDSILSGDLRVLRWFTEDGNISVKIDGSPAIVWGTNPATKKFFVGTKSVFNKKLIKINHSHKEIDKNHTGFVAKVLHACFDNLPKSKKVYQGDFIGFGGDYIYRPNTITYRFDKIIKQNIIIAPHTLYHVKQDLRDAIAIPSCIRSVTSSPSRIQALSCFLILLTTLDLVGNSHRVAICLAKLHFDLIDSLSLCISASGLINLTLVLLVTLGIDDKGTATASLKSCFT